MDVFDIPSLKIIFTLKAFPKPQKYQDS